MSTASGTGRSFNQSLELDDVPNFITAAADIDATSRLPPAVSLAASRPRGS